MEPMITQKSLVQIDPLATSVFADVAKNIGVLKGQAQATGVPKHRLIDSAKDAGRETSDCAGHLVTVVIERRPVGKLERVEVTLYAADDQGQVIDGQIKVIDHGAQGLDHRVADGSWRLVV